MISVAKLKIQLGFGSFTGVRNKIWRFYLSLEGMIMDMFNKRTDEYKNLKEKTRKENKVPQYVDQKTITFMRDLRDELMFDFLQFWQCEKTKYICIQLHFLFFWGFKGLLASCIVFNVCFQRCLQRNIAALEDGCNATSSFRFMQNSGAGEKKKIWQCSHNAPTLYISFVYLLSKYTNTGAISSLFPSQMMARLEELVEREDPEETWLAWAECQHSNTLLREMTHTHTHKYQKVKG